MGWAGGRLPWYLLRLALWPDEFFDVLSIVESCSVQLHRNCGVVVQQFFIE